MKWTTALVPSEETQLTITIQSQNLTVDGLHVQIIFPAATFARNVKHFTQYCCSTMGMFPSRNDTGSYKKATLYGQLAKGCQVQNQPILSSLYAYTRTYKTYISFRAHRMHTQECRKPISNFELIVCIHKNIDPILS